jgi:hypothetical protein
LVVTLQSYTVLWPLNLNGTLYTQGMTVTMDDAAPGTLQLLAQPVPVIALTSGGGTAATLASDQQTAAYETAHGVPPFKDYRGEQGQDKNPPTQPLDGVDGSDGLRYQ